MPHCFLFFFFDFFADFLYRHSVTFDSVTTEVEIMDTSKCAVCCKVIRIMVSFFLSFSLAYIISLKRNKIYLPMRTYTHRL